MTLARVGLDFGKSADDETDYCMTKPIIVKRNSTGQTCNFRVLVRDAQLRPPSRSVRGACYVAQRFWTEQGRRLAASDASIWEVDDADDDSSGEV